MDAGGSNFYSQIAADMSDNSFDESCEEKPNLGSVDVDVADIDASLFSSLSANTSRRRTTTHKDKLSTAQSNTLSPVRNTQPLISSAPESQDMSVGGPSKLLASAQAVKKSEGYKTKPMQEPKPDYEDDILDILSDGDAELPTKRTKAKLKHTKKVVKQDEKPITSTSEAAVASSLVIDTPKKSKKSSDSKNTVTFDDDDDDILGGLGFDEPAARSTNAVANSRLDDLLGTSKPLVTKTKLEQNAPVTLSDNVKTAAATNDPDNSFQFGGYVPSSVESRLHKRSSLRVPSGRRKGSSEIDPTLVTRPSTASSPMKKSVRFPEDLERPSTATAAVVKSPRRERRELVTEDSVPGANGGATKIPAATILTLDDSLLGTDTKSSGGGRRALFDEQPLDTQIKPPNADKQPPDTQLKPPNADKLEHPVFPWQRGGRTSSLVSAGRQSKQEHTSTDTDTHKQPQSNKPTTTENAKQNAMLTSFQEQLLEQQKRLQEQLVSFQSESASASAAAKASSRAEVETLQTQLKNAEEKVKELETALVKNNTELCDKQKSLQGVEQDLAVSQEANLNLEAQFKVVTDQLNTLDKEATHEKHELMAQIEDLKMKLYKVELERDQLQHAIEATKNRHKEEIESIQRSNGSKMEALEESSKRRETRWKEEVTADTLRFQEKLTLLEQEKTDSVLVVKKKMNALEITKTNELSRLKDVHYSAIEDLKREHELNKQHLLNLHRQELEAVKAAHSHTRMLSDLSHKVEVSTRDMTQLQAKLEGAHSTELEDRMQRVKAHEEHIKVLEAQVLKQKLENNTERDQLQSLIAKMESHVSQQKKQLEQDRWDLQQHSAKLTAQQNAFQEERTSSLLKLETERERLEQAKEKFLSEQQDILSQCYEERRSVASDRVALSVQQQKALEKEKRDKQHGLQIEADRESLSNQLREGRAQLVVEQDTLRQDQEQLRLDREAAARDMMKLEAYGAEIHRGSQDIEHITEAALLVREQGEQSMAESERLREQLTIQQSTLTVQRESLVEREKQLVVDKLSVAEERKWVHQLKALSPSEVEAPLLQSSLTVGAQESILTASLQPYCEDPSESNSSCVYTPTPLRVSALSNTPPHQQQQLQTILTKIDNSHRHRHWVLQAKKDDEYLEQETNFIESLQTQPYIH